MKTSSLYSGLAGVAVLASAAVVGAGFIVRAGEPMVALVPDQDCYESGDQLVVTVRLMDLGTEDLISGGSFELEYEPGLLQFADLAPAPPFAQDGFTNLDEVLGTIGFAVESLTPIPPPGPPADMATITFEVLSGDVCAEAGLVRFVPGGGTVLADENADPVTPTVHDLPPISSDDFDPQIVSFTLANAEVDDDCRVITEFETFINDNCNVAEAGCRYGIVAGAASIVSASCNVSGERSPHAKAEGSVTIANVRACPVTVRVTIFGRDDCGRETELEVFFDVTDAIGPKVPDGSIDYDAGDVLADAGGVCDQAWVNVPFPFDEFNTSDNCTDFEDLDIWNDYTGTEDASGYYPTGTTTPIVWYVADRCGTTTPKDQDIEVGAALNAMGLLVEISPEIDTGGAYPQELHRAISYRLFDPACGTPVDYCQEATFMVESAGADAVALEMVYVPCGTYDCITAKDRFHTLRRTDGLTTGGSNPVQWDVDFVAAEGKQLIGGDLDDDCDVNIVDFGGMLGYCDGIAYADGGTLCLNPLPPVNFHCDITGDGNPGGYSEPDAQIILDNFLSMCDQDCCTLGGYGFQPATMVPDEGPIVQISVGELRDRGWGDLIVADLNNDGWLDPVDLALYILGVRPQASITEF